jgi:hypothetical protein
MHYRNCPIIVCILIVLGCGSTLGQQAPSQRQTESTKYRTIFTIAGGGGGFAVGLLAGLAAYDESTYGTRKTWTASLIGATVGAVGGYFLGRYLDKRNNKSPVTWVPNEFEQNRLHVQTAAYAHEYLQVREFKFPKAESQTSHSEWSTSNQAKTNDPATTTGDGSDTRNVAIARHRIMDKTLDEIPTLNVASGDPHE